MCADVGQTNCTARIGDESDLLAFNEMFCCCEGKSTAAPFAGYVFWIIFFIIGGNVLLTLFIGVITTSMEEAQSQQKEEKQNEADIEEAATSIGFSKVTVANYRLVFNLLDLDRDGTLDEDELKIGLRAIGYPTNEDTLQELYSYLDIDTSQDISYVQFMKMLSHIKTAEAEEKSSNDDDVENVDAKEHTEGDISTSSYTGAVIEKNIESSQASKNGEKYKVQVEGDLESGV